MNVGNKLKEFRRLRPVTWMIAISSALCVVAAANADQISTAPGFGPFQIDSGGEFTVIPDAGVSSGLSSSYSPSTRNWVVAGSFQTFCVERNEYITPGTTFDVTYGNTTIFSGKPLTVGAAYLYEQFATGALNYNYSDSPAGTRAGYASSVYNAFNLQQAIWYFMGEISYDQYNPYMNNNVTLPSNPFAPDNGAHGVTVLSLWAPGQPHDPEHAYQDVLMLGVSVPEPGTFALAVLGVLGFITARRRK